MEKWTKLLQDFCSLFGDYRRQDDIAIITPGRVSRWLRQFERFGYSESGLKTILISLSKVLVHTYITKDEAVGFLDRLVKHVVNKSGVPKEEINFLSLQEAGKSQSDLLLLAEEHVLGRGVSECGGSDVYLYVDDVVYSGNRFRYELGAWMKDRSPVGAKIYSGHIVMHSQGAEYSIDQLRIIAKSKGLEFYPARKTSRSNDKKKQPYEVLWPRELEDLAVRAYVQMVQKRAMDKYGFAPAIGRTGPAVCDLFGAEDRDVLEKAFLIGGLNLVNQAANPSPSMRPMGFEVLEGFGFGALTVTWRNIANNCPLVLWYGDPDNYPASHPFGRWFPLFPRKGGA